MADLFDPYAVHRISLDFDRALSGRRRTALLVGFHTPDHLVNSLRRLARMRENEGLAVQACLYSLRDLCPQGLRQVGVAQR